MSDRRDERDDETHAVDQGRRLLLGGIMAADVAGAAGTVPPADARRVSPARAMPISDADLRADIDTVVVIYAENRSFNNLFAGFPGLQQPLSTVSREKTLQRDRDGRMLDTLPKIGDGLVPDKQVVEHREYQIGPDDLAPIANGPFALSTPEGDPLPHGLVTCDLVHAFYNNQLQINGGRNDGFVAWGDSGALVMGH